MAGLHVLGVDIGGTHVTCGLVDAHSGRLAGERIDMDVDCHGPAGQILEAWATAMRRALAQAPATALRGVGIAMPGPFDYENGICLLRGVEKYDALYGFDIRAELKTRLELPAGVPMIFRNDAACFLLGEAWAGAARGCRRAIGVTLGTGFGSSFLADNQLVEQDESVPADGFFYCVPFRGRTAEDHFSGRALLRLYREHGGPGLESVLELARRAVDDRTARTTFAAYGSLLAQFLAPWISRFHPDVIVFGGSISRSWDLFAPSLTGALGQAFPHLKLLPSELFEGAALIGSARLPLLFTEPTAPTQRQGTGATS